MSNAIVDTPVALLVPPGGVTGAELPARPEQEYLRDGHEILHLLIG